MPYVSDRQRRWAHTKDAKRKGFPTKEFDAAERRKNRKSGKRMKKHRRNMMREMKKEFGD